MWEGRACSRAVTLQNYSTLLVQGTLAGFLTHMHTQTNTYTRLPTDTQSRMHLHCWTPSSGPTSPSSGSALGLKLFFPARITIAPCSCLRDRMVVFCSFVTLSMRRSCVRVYVCVSEAKHRGRAETRQRELWVSFCATWRSFLFIKELLRNSDF